MIVKLGQPATKAFAKGFTRATVSQMVKEYRKDPKSAPPLKYAHFTVKEILELLVANQILDPKLSIEAQANTMLTSGLKIYIAKHIAGTSQDAAHDKKITTILVNTNIVGGRFYDILDDIKSISFAGYGDGLDQAEISPPYHENPGDDTPDEDVNYIKL